MSNGTLTTATKQFSEEVLISRVLINRDIQHPNDVIDVTLVGSPGASKEESVTLDATKNNLFDTRYTFTETHAIYEVQLYIENGGDTTPLVESVSLIEDTRGKNITGLTWTAGDLDSLAKDKNNVVYDNTSDLLVLDNIIPDSVVDNLEEVLYEDKNNTLSDYYGGDLSSASRQTSTVKDGSYALEIGDGAKIASTSGLPNYPSAGDSFDVYVYVPDSDFPAFGFGVQDATNSWDNNANEVLLDFRGGQPDLKTTVRENGMVVSEQDGTSDTNPTAQWCRLNISWTSTDFTVELIDSSGSSIDTVTNSDGTWSSGGIGFGGNGTATYFDELFIQ